MFLDFQILYDFEILFKTVDGDALLNIWPTITSKPCAEFETNIDGIVCPFNDGNLLNLLTWLRLFSNKRTLMKTLLNNFIVFSDVRILTH